MRKTKYILLLVVLCASSMLLYSESKEDSFYARLSKRSSEITSLTSDFVQIKQVKLLDTKVVSKGKFYYKKRAEIRFDYSSPKKMSIVMFENKLDIVTLDKTTSYDFSKQKSLAELSVVMNACISGKLKELPEKYKVDYQEGKKFHNVSITNLKRTPDNPYTKIELHFDLENYSLIELILYERSQDTTTYSFFNMVTNG